MCVLTGFVVMSARLTNKERESEATRSYNFLESTTLTARCMADLNNSLHLALKYPRIFLSEFICSEKFSACMLCFCLLSRPCEG